MNTKTLPCFALINDFECCRSCHFRCRCPSILNNKSKFFVLCDEEV